VSAARVVLWRHGRTAYNHSHRFQGQLDVPLDDVGMAQAEAAGALLAARLSGAGPVRLMTSDLSRAWMTADALARRLGMVAERDPALREIFSGAWEGLSRDEIDARWPDDWAAWRRGEDVRIGGGETRSEAARRAVDAIVVAAAGLDGGTLVAVSHGASLRGAVALLLGAPATEGAPADERHNPFAVLRNAHWAELEVLPGAWRLLAYNLGAPDVAPTSEPGDTADEGEQADGTPGRDLEPAGVAGVDSPGRDDGGQ